MIKGSTVIVPHRYIREGWLRDWDLSCWLMESQERDVVCEVLVEGLSEDVRRPLRENRCGTYEGRWVDIPREGIYVGSEKGC